MINNLSDRLENAFVVVAQPRSGSTLLARALHDHDAIECHDELFARHWVQGFRPKTDTAVDPGGLSTEFSRTLLAERTADPERFLFTRVFLKDARHKVGFKVVYSDLFGDDPESRFLREFITTRRIPVVHLRRLNLLRCFLSVERMRNLGVTHSDQTETSTQKLSPSLTDLVSFMVSQDTNCDVVARTMNVVVNPRYEHLPQGYNVTLDALGVERRPFVQRLSRLASESLADLVEDPATLTPFDFPRTSGFCTYSA